MDYVLQILIMLIPLMTTCVLVVIALAVAHVVLIRRNRHLGSDKLFSRQLIMLGLTLAGLLAIVLAMPVEESSRNQIVALIGLLISGLFAFSSTNIFANLASGILLRVTRPFEVGDFISLRDHFGRVAERGLFDTEIQSENGELISVPNKYLISHPVSSLRGTDAIVSASVSLGYETHHARIEELLHAAAEHSGLDNPFVHITELGSYTVTYRVSGVLPEAKRFVTARSNLYKSILDELHANQIEIMSPAYMNQRQITNPDRLIPASFTGQAAPANSVAEDILFDKAEQAQQLLQEKERLMAGIAALEVQLKEVSDEQRQLVLGEMTELKERLQRLEKPEDSPDQGSST